MLFFSKTQPNLINSETIKNIENNIKPIEENNPNYLYYIYDNYIYGNLFFILFILAFLIFIIYRYFTKQKRVKIKNINISDSYISDDHAPSLQELYDNITKTQT